MPLPVDEFIRDGFLKVAGGFPREVAEQCSELLWAQLDSRPDDPRTWTLPVVRLGYQEGGPFERAANTPRLHAAYDALVGVGRWLPRTNLGTFPIRFPSAQNPDDDGWHVDSSYPPALPDQSGDPFAWRVNVASRGRALLMLFLLTDVGVDDAPTRLRVGSHRDVAALLAPYGDDGLTMLEVSQRAAEATADRPVSLATGEAGDVYLCHPFLVHAAQRHRGSRPKIMAQPPLHPQGWIKESLDPVAGLSPVEVAIRAGIQFAR